MEEFLLFDQERSVDQQLEALLLQEVQILICCSWLLLHWGGVLLPRISSLPLMIMMQTKKIVI